MERRSDDPEVERTLKRVPYEVAEAEWRCPRQTGRQGLQSAGGLRHDPGQDQSGLRSLSRWAITQAVITVPAYFNDAQRNAPRMPARLPGLEVLRIVNEPTASSLAYGLDKKKNEVIAVYDLGGGTFDISVLDVGDGVFQVRSTSGDTFLGGDDFDQRIMDYLADQFQKDNGIDLRGDRQALQRLKEASEKAKIELSTMMQTEINLPYITADAGGPKHLVTTLHALQDGTTHCRSCGPHHCTA